jgi:transposase
LYKPALPRSSHQLAPDFASVHQELKRAGVTLQLLWEEYAKDNALAYKYTSFCVKYREWALGLKRSMRQTHIAGEKLFVDYAGQTVPIVDATTGEITQAQIFVATFGASNYTYACATARQTTADWIGAQVQALEFFGGLPRLIVPDQARALIKNPDTYDPQPNRLYDEFANHYGCALLAARPAHPRDKPKVENAVLVVERWILARLRNRRFFHLVDLNKAIALLLTDLNQRAFVTGNQGVTVVDSNPLDTPSPDNLSASFPTSCRVADDPVRRSRKSRCRSCSYGHGVSVRRIAAAFLSMRSAALGSACPTAHDQNPRRPAGRWLTVCAVRPAATPPGP